jgi:hypothetical protein
MVVLSGLAGVNPPMARHPEVEDEAVPAVGVDQPIFGAPPEPDHSSTGQPLAEVDRQRPAKIRPARLDRRQPPTLKHLG